MQTQNTPRKTTLRIGNASGYWGDDPEALERQVNGGRLDYISMDFLAEITMSIMQKQRARDPNLGYARDLLPMLEKVLPKLLSDKTCLITNAGGVNPAACAAAIAKLAASKNLPCSIAIVYGDDILHDLPAYTAQGVSFDNMENGAKFTGVADRIDAANIYFGAAGVVEALKWRPDIVITGRVTDTGITLAPMIHEFGWSMSDWDKLASGIVAGHMIECGAQASGGNFTDWRLVPSFQKIGFPIVEAEADGSFVITKHPGSGGLVSVDTVREQLVYEMGNPRAYITPDVIADFTSIQLKAAGPDRVHVSGVRGFEPTPTYKVSMAYRDGYKAQGAIVVSGPEARAKAEQFARNFWERIDAPLTARETEYAGWNACHRSLAHYDDGAEIILRLGARAETEAPLKVFGKHIPPLILSGPPGVAVLGGVPKAQEVVSYWPALLPKALIQPKVALYTNKLGDAHTVTSTQTGNFKSAEAGTQTATTVQTTLPQAFAEHKHENAIALTEICLARSGDKGDTANIGVLARSPKAYAFIREYLTAQRVKDWFQELCGGNVVRYEVPNLQGLNFLLENSLGGGGTMTLRTDAQGKTFAQALLRQRVVIPKDVLQDVKAHASR